MQPDSWNCGDFACAFVEKAWGDIEGAVASFSSDDKGEKYWGECADTAKSVRNRVFQMTFLSSTI
jgi:hypothetical protein